MGVCNTGKILRKGYVRRSYTRKNGTKVRAARVINTCIKNRGGTGKWSNEHKEEGIGLLKKGRLTKYGYSSSHAESTRRVALNKAIRAYGELAVYRMLNAIYVYTRNTSPAQAAVYKADRDWIGFKAGYGSNSA